MDIKQISSVSIKQELFMCFSVWTESITKAVITTNNGQGRKLKISRDEYYWNKKLISSCSKRDLCNRYCNTNIRIHNHDISNIIMTSSPESLESFGPAITLTDFVFSFIEAGLSLTVCWELAERELEFLLI